MSTTLPQTDARAEVEKVLLQILRRRRPDLTWTITGRPATPAPLDAEPLARHGALA